jgi:tetratricopeptide (TPR) repeat protein
LETIRQFIEDQHATTGGLVELRDRHAHHFADQAIAHWVLWDGPGYDTAIGWVEVELDNLRAANRWATDRDDLPTATAIASHTTMLTLAVQQYEPAGWAEGLLPAAIAANVPQLPRLFTAASTCMFMGRADDAVGYAEAAVALQDDPGFEPFTNGWAHYRAAQAHGYAGRLDRYLDIYAALSAQTGLAHLIGLCGLIAVLPHVGRSDEAIAIASDTTNAARAHANPYFIAFAYLGAGMAYAVTDPHRALDTWREGLAYTQHHRLTFWETIIARDAAGLETVHGDLDHGLDLYAKSINTFHQSGNHTHLAMLFARLVVLFNRIDRPEAAATLHGNTAHNPAASQMLGLAAAVDHLRHVLDTDTFDNCVRIGAAMNTSEAVHYAHHHLQLTRLREP